jgi:hypothetical protein
MASTESNAALQRRCRIAIALFVAGLVASGMTAFPLLTEVRELARWLGVGEAVPTNGLSGLRLWIATVRDGLATCYGLCPWLGYGTDWLAFGHLAIALFFIGPWRDPVRNAWVLRVGLVACALVFPLALIAGAVRGIPFYWRLIDCSFGAFGALPLLYALRLVRRMEAPREEKG